MSTYDRRVLLILFVLLWFGMAYVHQRLFDAPTPVSRLNLLHALVTHGMVSIDAYHTNTPDKAIFEGRYYSDKAPGTVALAFVPFALTARTLGWLGVGLDSPEGWRISSWVACAGSIGLVTAVGGVAIFAWLSMRVPPRAALITTLALFLGAAPLPYATMMFSHALVVGLLAIALWAIEKQHTAEVVTHGHWPWARTHRWALLAGWVCGWALASEYSSGLVVVGLALWLISVARGAWVPFGMAAAIPLLLIPAYSWACFGDPFTLPYSHQASFPAMQEGLYAIRWPDAETAVNLLFSPARGLLFWTPFLVMAFAGYPELIRRSSALFWLAYAVPVLHIAILSGRVWDWQAGPTLGPRLLAPILPLLALPCALGLKRFPFVGGLLAIGSVLLTTLATLTDACPSYNRHPNPLLDLHVPLFLEGQVSPNLGRVLGLPPYPSVLLYYAVIGGLAVWLWRRLPAGDPDGQPGSASAGSPESGKSCSIPHGAPAAITWPTAPTGGKGSIPT